LWTSYRQKDLLANELLKYHYLNFAPSLLINYAPNSITQFRFNYEGSTQQPSITQLQPIKNNNDPLHITLGNQNLRPSYTQNLRLQFIRSKTWLLNLTFTLGLMSNNISTKTIIDSLGRQVSQLVNVDGSQDLGLNFSANKKLWGLDVGINSNVKYSRNVNYINTDLARNDSYTSITGFDVGKYVPEKYSIQLAAQFTYFDSRSSVNSTAAVHYWMQNHSGNLTLFFIRGFEINTNAVYTWQQKSTAFAKNTSVVLWNFSIVRNFLSDRLALRFQANNVLNQNSGISRYNLGNVNTETSTNILGRCWLLSLTYRFDHKYRNK
jgi:outer membrane receptor protein involved in Fe transport